MKYWLYDKIEVRYNNALTFNSNIKSAIKVAYTSGPIFEKIMKRYPIFSMQIINYQIDQKYK